jgi:23S rRNA (pseudouridine1915-N3)-methyltransferase
MKLRVVAVGGVKPAAARELCDEYFGRIKRYCAFEEKELKAAPDAKLLGAFRKASEGATLVALDERGDSMTSRQLAVRLERLAARGKGVVAFAIGGAEGLPRGLTQHADECWSLSRLTLPHRLARVVLAEQLYRALTIMRGEPYDK